MRQVDCSYQRLKGDMDRGRKKQNKSRRSFRGGQLNRGSPESEGDAGPAPSKRRRGLMRSVDAGKQSLALVWINRVVPGFWENSKTHCFWEETILAKVTPKPSRTELYLVYEDPAVVHGRKRIVTKKATKKTGVSSKGL